MFNRILAEANPRSVERYIKFLTNISLAGVLAWAVALGVTWFVTKPAFFTRYVGEATPGTLGAIRMLVCFVLLMMTLAEDLSSTALFPREMIKRIGVLQLFYVVPGFQSFLVNETALLVFQIITASLLLLGALGWRTRIVIPLAAFSYLILGGILRQYGFFYHTGLVPLYVLIVLSFTRCGDGWSLDGLLKAWRGEMPPPRAAAIYGWARYACWAVVAIPYLAAGLSKIRNGGLMWWTATNMRSILYTCTLQPLNFDWTFSLYLPAPEITFSILGLAGMIGEITFILVLFSKVARLVLPSIMLSMHVGITFLQNIFFWT